MTIGRFHAPGCALLAVTLAFATPAHAHHSFAMYDSNKTVTVEGTVKEFDWTNPHVVLRIVTSPAAPGEVDQLWTLELPAPSQIARNGWTHSTLAPGDKVKVDLHPFRDGRLGGSLVTATLADGQVIGR
jgi:Family of unknown function (DUF6152)